ncbi:hypothetical protein [Mycolicibacterium sp. XJ879]
MTLLAAALTAATAAVQAPLYVADFGADGDDIGIPSVWTVVHTLTRNSTSISVCSFGIGRSYHKALLADVVLSQP